MAAVTCAVLVLGAAATPLWLRGARFGRLVEQRLPHTRGQVHVGGGSWSWGTAWALWRGRAAPLVFDDVSVTDPDGVVVFQARRLAASIERTHAPEGLLIRELRVQDGMWRMARTTDHKGIGFLRALEQARPSGGAHTGSGASGGGLRALRCERILLDGLDVDFDLPGWALALRQVHGQGALALLQGDHGPPLFTFAVTDTDVRGGGKLAVLDGTWRTTLPFSSVRIARIAAESAAPDAITLDASGLVTGRSTTAVRGAFVGILPVADPSKAAGLKLDVTMEDAADAVQAIAAIKGWTPRLQIAGARATLAMSFAGPFSAPQLAVGAAGFDVRFGALVARAFGFHLDAQVAARKLVLHDLAFDSPAGGRLSVNARLDRGHAEGTMALQRFGTAPYLPPGLRTVASGTVDGQVAGHVELGAGTAALDRVALTIARPAGAGRPTAVHVVTAGEPIPPRMPGDSLLRLGHAWLDRGTLDLPRVTASVAGGQLAASGAVTLWDPARREWLPSPSFDVALDVSRLSVEKLLGVGLITGQVSLRARAQGTFEALTLRARVPAGQQVHVLGGAFGFSLPPVLLLSLADGTITLAPLALSSADGAQLTARGSVTTDGRLALQARAAGVALRPIVAWATGLPARDVPVDGRVGVDLALAGELAAPAATGTLTIGEARLRGHALGGGTLVLATGPRGELRVRGPVVDGIALDGFLQRDAHGARAAATLTLSRLRLDPFLMAFGFPVALTGETSGKITASLAPYERPRIGAVLSKLAIATRPPKSGGTSALTLEAKVPVRVGMSAAGTVRLEPTRFEGSAGSLDLSGEWRGANANGHVTGRLNASAFAPLLRNASHDIVTDLDGALEVDVGLTSANGVATADGSLAIAAPVRARFAALPFDVVAPAGSLLLKSSGGASVRGLLLNVRGLGADPALLDRSTSTLRVDGGIDPDGHGAWYTAMHVRGTVEARLLEPLARGYLRDAEGQARIGGLVTGPVDGHLDRLRLAAHVNVGGMAFTLMPGANRIRLASGDVDIGGSLAAPVLALSNVDVRIGDGNQLVIGGAARDRGHVHLAPGGSIATAQVDLPVQGRVRSLATPVAIIDAASFGVRLIGVFGRTLRLGGDIFIDAAHVPPSLRRPKKPAPAAAGDTARAALNATQLDLRIHSKPRAVTVEVAHVPDLHAALDYHLGGTVGAPEVKGSVQPAGFYSSVLLFLARLLD